MKDVSALVGSENLRKFVLKRMGLKNVPLKNTTAAVWWAARACTHLTQ